MYLKRTKNNGISHHINFIRKIAWSYHKSSGIEYQDLFQECCLSWMENKQRWNPEKGKITTFMYYCLQYRLNDYLNQQIKYKSPLKEITTKIDKPINSIPYFENLPPESLAVARIILSNPMKFICCTKETAIDRIFETLMEEGYQESTINTGIKYLQQEYKRKRKRTKKASPINSINPV